MNETMKDGERAAFEAWWEAKCRLFVVHDSQEVAAWLAWQARAASPQSGEKGDEPFRAAVEEMVALLENGEWAEHVAESIANGDELASRLETAITELHNDIGAVREARAAAPQAALSGEQKQTIQRAAHMIRCNTIPLPDKSHCPHLLAEQLDVLLTQAPTERMSDAVKVGSIELCVGGRVSVVGNELWCSTEKYVNHDLYAVPRAARKAEIERGEGGAQ